MRLYLFVISSVLLHTLFYVATHEYMSHFETPLTTSEVEIELLEEEEIREYKVIEDFAMPEPDSYDPSDTSFLSGRTLKFEKQQRAERMGPTENRAPEPSQNPSKDLIKKMEAINKLSAEVIEQIKIETLKKSEVTVARKRSRRSNNSFQAKQGVSTFYDPNTNLEIGTMTVLNTNRYLFYTFFERVKGSVGPHWASRNREIIDSRPNLRRRDWDRSAWTTEIEIVLTPKGEFIRGDVFRSSGLQQFDLSTIDAFKKGAPFQNPPQEMVGEDGLIHLRYNFTYFWNPQSSIQVTN